MKRLILSQFILCLSGMALFSQQPQKNWELSTDESGTKEYIARDFIKLNPGFTYKAIGDDTFTAKIDEYLVFPPNNATYGGPDGTIGSTPSSGGVVGSIPGSFNVSPTGAATYTIPIEVPAGINGMQPNISLVYNSQAGNGIAGWGWNIGGISMISRVPKSFYYDGEVSGIDWTKDSPLALDGQRLIKISTSEYRTENESFNRISASSIQTWGPEIITVTTKDGLVMEYGQKGSLISYSPISSTKRLGWLLSKVYDQWGNYLKYNYSYGAGVTYKDLVLQSITYGNENSGHEILVGKIDFIYKVRSDQNEGFVEGISTRNNRLLEKIEVHSSSSLLKTYELTYNFDGNYSQLAEVSLKNDLGEQVNPIAVHWQKDGQAFSKFGSEDFAFQSNNVTERPIYGDFNGNGRRDFITYKDGLVTLYVNNDYLGSVDFTKEFEFTIYGDNPKGVVPADLNGDGKLDIIAITQAPNGTYRYNFYFSDGESFSNGGGTGYKGFNTTKKDNDYIIGDFNGDGKHNILIKSTLKVYNNAGNIIGSGGIPNWGKELVSSFPNNRYLIDFTGNGKTNICILDDSQARIYELANGTFSLVYNTSLVYNSLGILPGDYNIDGKTDLLIQKVNSSAPGGNDYYILFATGNSFSKKDLPDLNLSDKTFTADFNLDGRTDLIVCKPDNSNGSSPNDITIKFAIGTYNGSTFSFTEHPSNMKYFYYNQGGYHKASMTYLDVADFSGDGRMEVCYDRYSDVRFIKSFNDASHLHVSKLTNSLGESTTLDYAPITSYIYSESSNASHSYPIASQRIPLYVASNVQSFGIINKSISYYYKDIILHKQGKGMLGFLSITEKDWQTGFETINVNSYNSLYHVLVPSLKQSFFRTTLVNQTNYSISLIGRGSKRFISRTNTITNVDYLKSTTQIQSFSNYDDFENPKTITTDYGGGWKETQKLTYIKKGSWCDNKISTLETTYENTDENPITLKKGYDYSDKGKLVKESSNLGTSDVILTEYLNYDSFGNPRTIKTTAKGDVREVEMTYLEGRFLHTEKNVQLNETTIYSYDLTKGFVKSKTDPMGTTSYKYDGFGRLTEVTYPNKIKTAIARQWSGDSSPNGPKYFIFEETSGQGSVKTLYDGLGREVRKNYYGLGNELRSITTKYDNKGRLYQVSEPHTGSSPSTWGVTYGYDDYGRKETVTTPAGITSYSYPGLKTTVTSPTGTSETTLNSAGKVVESKVNEKRVTYKYYPTGQKSKAIPEGGPAVEFEYDLLGNRTVLKDPNAGIIRSEYNGFGQILKNTHKIHTGPGDSITTYKYFASGLIDEISVHGEITKYKYDSKNRIEKIGIAGVHEQSFMYDSDNRPIKITETIDGTKTYDFKTEYDSYGRVKKEVHPSGFYVSNEYDENGFLTSVTGSKGQKIWEAVAANVKGQLTRYKQGGFETVVDYHDLWGLPNSIVSGNRINMTYYYTEKGNLDYREDRSTSGRIQKEKFYYDAANRLENYDVSLNGTLKQSNTILYDPLTGGIQNKTDVGFKMEYGQNAPFHALSVVQGLPESAKAPQAITYSNINKVKSITQGNKVHQITYGVNQQRIKGLFKTGSATTLTKYYLGNYEEEVVSGSTRKLHYIYGGNGLAAIMEYKNGQENLFYTFSDYQGNLLAVTNTAGTERYAYDPWGARRNPDDWTQPDTRSSLLFSRGYTMHEHLDDFGLINMNGRVYDPLMAQFFSPDPYIQSPGNWYNYNRYAYCYNNPLIYTDPDGEWIHLVIGAAIGGTFNWIANGAEFSWKGLGYFGVGAASGALGAGIGSGMMAASAGSTFGAGFIGTQSAMSAIASGYTSSFISGATIGGVSGFAGGFTTGFGNGLIQGQSFGDALWSGSKSGLIGGGTGALFGGLVSGLDAVGDNRNFWNGDNVEIGRNRFSLVNKPVSSDELYYVDADGNLYPKNQFDNATNRRINVKFFEEGGTYDRFSHQIDLENHTSYRTSASIDIHQRIKGFAGVEYGPNYWPHTEGVSFTTNNGLNRLINSGPGSFSFRSKGLSTLTGTILGKGLNDGNTYAPNMFRLLIRIK